MKYSTTIPTADGHYWQRTIGKQDGRVIRLQQMAVYTPGGHTVIIGTLKGICEWAGPIEEPTDSES